jgi:hypothetical protein
MPEAVHYRRPGWFTQNVANKIVALLTRAGVSIWGSRVLEVPGRKSGLPRQVPVNLLTFDGHQYLVSARGEGEWVRNVRAADGHLDLTSAGQVAATRWSRFPSRWWQCSVVVT